MMPAMAALFNYFIFSNIGLGVLALISTVIHVKAWLLLVKSVPFLALATAVYFQFRRASAAQLTPGDLIVGFRIRTEGKEWNPPFKGTILWWLILCVINFYVLASYWEFLSYGYIYNWSELLLRALICILFFGAMVSIGQGRITAFLGILIIIGADYFLLPYLYSNEAIVANGHYNLTIISQIKSGLWASVNSMGLLIYLYYQNPGSFTSLFKRVSGK
ncbi:hypothetical protein EBR96_06330 [bacterium]|nr:hypothetical protein [bacterium]